MSFFQWPEYVSVAERRRQAEAKIASLRKKGRSLAPVKIEGRKIAKTFWGQSWCANLERYSDFASRLPRGRSYVRNGLVIDLQIVKGKVKAVVSGSDLYDVEITIAPLLATQGTRVVLAVHGRGAAPTHRVMLDGRELETRYVGRGELEAIIPPDAIAAAGTYKVTVKSVGEPLPESHPAHLVVGFKP